MSTCSGCGSEVSSGFAFCPRCGRRLPSPCPACGFPASPISRSVPAAGRHGARAPRPAGGAVPAPGEPKAIPAPVEAGRHRSGGGPPAGDRALRRSLRVHRARRAARSRGGARVPERAVRDAGPGDHALRRLRGEVRGRCRAGGLRRARSLTRTIRSGPATPRSTCSSAARGSAMNGRRASASPSRCTSASTPAPSWPATSAAPPAPPTRSRATP